MSAALNSHAKNESMKHECCLVYTLYKKFDVWSVTVILYIILANISVMLYFAR